MALFLLHGLIVGTWVSRIPTVQVRLGLSNGILGVTLLSQAMGSVLCIPLAGKWVAQHGSKVVSVVAGVAFSVSLALLGLAVNAQTLALTLLLFGASAATMDVAMNAQGVEIEKQLRTPTMSRFHAMFSFGAMGGAAVGGLAANHGITPAPHFAFCGLIYATAALLVRPLLLREEAEVHPQETRLRFKHIPSLLWALIGIGFCMLLSEGAMADWTAVYLKQALGAGPGRAAAGYAVFSAAMATFRLTGDFTTAHLGRYRTVLCGSLAGAAGVLWALSMNASAWVFPGLAIAGMGFSVIIPLVFGSGGRVKGINPGTGIATVTGIGYFAFIVGPPTIGLLSQLVTLRYALGLVVLCCLISAYLSRALRELG
jgi:MFS family permease